MAEIRIATWNIGDKKIDLKKENLKVKAIIDLVNNNKLYCLALQNMNLLLADKLRTDLYNKTDYNLAYNYDSLRPLFASKKKKASILFNPFVIEEGEAFAYGFPIISDGKRENNFGRVLTFPYDNGFQFINGIFNQEDSDINLSEMKYFLGRIESFRKIYSDKRKHDIFASIDLGNDINNNKYFLNKMRDMYFKSISISSLRTSYLFTPCSYEIGNIKSVDDYLDLSSDKPLIVTLRK